MARRINAAQIGTTRLEVEGEWLEHKSSIPYGDFSKMQSAAAGEDEADANHRMIALFTTAWSFTGEDGETLPVTFENVKDNADSPVLTALFLEIIGSDFLERMSRLKKVGS